jgi:hypothetical protein
MHRIEVMHRLAIAALGLLAAAGAAGAAATPLLAALAFG